jgi:hypothetical protein
MLLLGIELNSLYISIRHVEKSSGFITITNDSISLFTVMLNVHYSSSSESSLFTYSQEYSHVIFKYRRKVLLYLHLSSRKLLGFYITYRGIR